ncbi:hypothetical protein CI109_103806 [Kwoniella shandongensis]|uniref:Uncharacterized protein n=1 Tax=Kwoniella shandongensis TaxID=1734106 RepID=A0A5M6CCT9_9TREE|nr:uncharacterized protein CI109_000500 [Kwoniella shandongensis]KAA5530929.1 hypothetical protein CI109_000500 [Kwoniella shandongensis]
MLATSFILPALSLLSAAVASPASGHALGARTVAVTSIKGGSYETCAKVAGDWFGYKYDFGCLCKDDVDEFASTNGIHSGIKSLISSYVSTHGSTHYYPPNSQPVCDNYGSYTCGSLSKQSSGACPPTTCDPKKTSTNGGCCPRGQTYSNGKCCGTVGCSRDQGKCTPVMQCPTYTSNDICCKTNEKGWTGYKTVCCPSGQQEDGSTGKCIPKCPTGKEYNPKTKMCETICDTKNGYSHEWSTEGKDLCCKKGETPYHTTCCPKWTVEIDHTGVCCPPGSKVEHGKCVSPTHGGGYPTKPKRSQLNFSPETPYGLEANVDASLCPSGFAACPIPGAAANSGSYECLDAMTDLQSCGGCASMGTGVDCTAIAGARWMGCSKGQCEVFSCKKGWTRSLNGTSCERN